MKKKYLIVFFALILSTALLQNKNSLNKNLMTIKIDSVKQQLDVLFLDKDGYYHFQYPSDVSMNPKDYGTIYYATTNPMARILWMSPDSFYVEHMGKLFGESVINYSTYSDNKGKGQQLFYVNPTLIGDTLDIFGYYYYYLNIIDSVKIIIDN